MELQSSSSREGGHGRLFQNLGEFTGLEMVELNTTVKSRKRGNCLQFGPTEST